MAFPKFRIVIEGEFDEPLFNMPHRRVGQSSPVTMLTSVMHDVCADVTEMIEPTITVSIVGYPAGVVKVTTDPS